MMTEKERIQSIRRNGGRQLKKFLRENITYGMCLTAVTEDGTSLAYVPEDLKDEQIYRAACQSSGIVLEQVPEKFRTKEICRMAIASDGRALQFVPEAWRTEETCLCAACQDGTALKYTPAEILTPTFCARVVRESGPAVVSHLPASCKKTDFYARLVSEEPRALWGLPEKYHTVRISQIAIERLGGTVAAAEKRLPGILTQIHPSLYDHDGCLTFVRSAHFKKMLTYYSWDRRDETGLLLDQEYNSLSLEALLQWEDVSLSAVKRKGTLLGDVPESVLTQEICTAAVKTDPGAYDMVPDRFRTKALCKAAFDLDYHYFRKFPDRCKTLAMCLAAVQRSGAMLKYVPEEWRTREILQEAGIVLPNEDE